MKTLLAALSFCLLLTVSSCKIGNDQTTLLSNASLTNYLITGTTWHVTNYSNNGSIETANYTNYIFTFSSPSTVKAINSGTIVSGGWVTLADNAGLKLQLSFTSPAAFAKFGKEWLVLESTSIRIRLQNGNELLTFEQ